LLVYFTTNFIIDTRAVVRSMSTGLPVHRVAALGVFNKVDNLVPAAADPWPVAVVRTSDQARALRRLFSDVAPVVALLAETVTGRRLTAADIAALRRFARLPEAERVALLASTNALRRPCGHRRERAGSGRPSAG
jgi:hypothetical protein